MALSEPQLDVRLVRAEQAASGETDTPQVAADRRGAFRLRYRVFVEELGSDGPLVDHAARTEQDTFDAICDHLVLVDSSRDIEACDHVIGVYRLLPGDRLKRDAPFYSESEYDLSALRRSGKRLLELGRSCVDANHRGGTAMYLLWNGLAQYIEDEGIDLLFGVASFHGTDVEALAQPLSHLHAAHLAPPELRPVVRPANGHPMDLMPEAAINRPAAMKATPALIKAYLRLGGYVGQGAFVDHAFNTTDVCLVLDTSRISAASRAIYTRASVS